jgi:general secretion pathway protein N
MIEALRRTGVRFAILGVLAYLVFLAANVPAAWLGYALERASAGAVALGDPRGTVWKGQGSLAVRSGNTYRSLAEIEWRCNPLGIFAGRLNLTISGEAPGSSLRAGASLGLSSVRLQGVEASVPAALLEAVDARIAFWKPDGRVRVLAGSLEVGAGKVLGGATVEWNDAGLSGVPRVGDYRLQVNGSGERAALTLSTLRGDLRVSARGEWTAAQPRVVQMSGEAEISSARKDLEALRPLLIGGDAGTRQFAWTITL